MPLENLGMLVEYREICVLTYLNALVSSAENVGVHNRPYERRFKLQEGWGL